MGEVVVLFEVTLREGCLDDYLERAAMLKGLISDEDGLLRAERFSSLAVEGKYLSLSVWRDEGCVERWRNRIEHRMCQRHGMDCDFEDYRITVATPVRTYTMGCRAQAPADSNEFHGC